MADHATTTALSRRQALGAVAAAATLTAMLGRADAATSPDTELLALGDAFEAAWARERGALDAGAAGDGDDPESEVSRAIEATTDLVRRILKLPAKTTGGLRVKVRAVCWSRGVCDIADDDFAGSEPSTEVRLVDSILRDLLATA